MIIDFADDRAITQAKGFDDKLDWKYNISKTGTSDYQLLASFKLLCLIWAS